MTRIRRTPFPQQGTEEPPDNLREPIEMLKALMRRTMEMSERGDDFQELVDFMEKYSRASTRMATLMKTQRLLAEEEGLGSALQQALDRVVNEMKRKKALGDQAEPKEYGS